MTEAEKREFIKEVKKHPVGKEQFLSQQIIDENFQEIMKKISESIVEYNYSAHF